MNVEELLQDVRDEGLDDPVLFDPGRAQADSVVVIREARRWRVYLADERAQPYEATIRDFDEESAALEYALVKLREVAAARQADLALRARRVATSGERRVPAQVQRLEHEMMSIGIDWTALSLSAGGDEAARILSGRHPDLSDDAVDALRWMFTYNRR